MGNRTGKKEQSGVAEQVLSTEDVAAMLHKTVDRAVEAVSAVAQAIGVEEDVSTTLYTTKVNGVCAILALIGPDGEVNDAIAERMLTERYH